MDLHSIHSCSKISNENLALRQKLLALKRVKDTLQSQLDELLKEKNVRPATKKEFASVAVQTESKSWPYRPLTFVRQTKDAKSVTESDLTKMNKVLEMHSQLLKRYDKEVKLNMTYADSVSDLNARLASVEQNLRAEKEKTLRLERELIVAKSKRHQRRGSDGDDLVLREVVQERNQLNKELKQLKAELKGLDHNFFEEIEDLKFALLQSAKLNSAYEKFVKKLCFKTGEPCPTPERLLKMA